LRGSAIAPLATKGRQQKPRRRATSDTLLPGFRLSTTIRALSSTDHCRRRAAPVISSIRRDGIIAATAGFVSSVCSSVWSIDRSWPGIKPAQARNVGAEHRLLPGCTLGPHGYKANGQDYLSASPSKKSMQRLKTKVANLLVPSNTDP
jgi:hypothetical protein